MDDKKSEISFLIGYCCLNAVPDESERQLGGRWREQIPCALRHNSRR